MQQVGCGQKEGGGKVRAPTISIAAALALSRWVSGCRRGLRATPQPALGPRLSNDRAGRRAAAACTLRPAVAPPTGHPAITAAPASPLSTHPAQHSSWFEVVLHGRIELVRSCRGQQPYDRGQRGGRWGGPAQAAGTADVGSAGGPRPPPSFPQLATAPGAAPAQEAACPSTQAPAEHCGGAAWE
jgi:hypothetical protein